MIFIAVAGVQQMRSATPIDWVRVQGRLRHLQLGDLRRVTMPLLTDFWFLDLQAIAAAVRRLPWVDRVRVERVWPNVVKLDIDEQSPRLRWGEKAFLNERGERFTPDDGAAYAHLPLLTGPEGYEMRLFSAYRKMAAALQPLGWRIDHLEVDNRRSWRLHLSNGAQIVLGRTEPEKTFALVVAALARMDADKRGEIELLDARYEHGFAIRWRTKQETGKKQPHG